MGEKGPDGRAASAASGSRTSKAILVGVFGKLHGRAEAEDHLDELERLVDTAGGVVVARALQERDSPDSATYVGKGKLKEIAEAAEASVRLWQRHVALIYVDVVEMQGTHIQRFYAGMAGRFEAFLRRTRAQDDLRARLAPEVEPLSAVMLASRIFLQYYAVEHLFRVPDQFGKPSKEAIHDIAEILRRGMLRDSRPVPAPTS